MAKRMMPNPDALFGYPTQHPHQSYVKMDATFKRHRGAQA